LFKQNTPNKDERDQTKLISIAECLEQRCIWES